MTAPTPQMSLPKRALHGPVPPVLVPIFRALDRHTGPISLAALREELGRPRIGIGDLHGAIATDTHSYVRTLVHTGPTYEALVMCWLPGQRSPVHDHGGSACAVRVISGAAVETVYALDERCLASPVSQRLFSAGEVVCSEDADVHTLANALTGEGRGEALVTIHIYSPALVGSRKYALRP